MAQCKISFTTFSGSGYTEPTDVPKERVPEGKDPLNCLKSFLEGIGWEDKTKCKGVSARFYEVKAESSNFAEIETGDRSLWKAERIPS